MTDTPERNADEAEVKRRFKEALEKKGRSKGRSAHEEGRLRVKSMSGAVGQKRFFRRKTG
ncbi:MULTISPECIES: DUF5302 domain-containing protein [unclassified Streptomyces]|uniref:DUF5302 domain-containing protein n=1 Tax=unclassified Streptomyces TaxID=2593676 RepID=UPI0033CD8453